MARDLTCRVDTAIGASGDRQGRPLAAAAQFGEHPLDLALDCPLPGLARPAREAAAVVGDRQARGQRPEKRLSSEMKMLTIETKIPVASHTTSSSSACLRT